MITMAPYLQERYSKDVNLLPQPMKVVGLASNNVEISNISGARKKKSKGKKKNISKGGGIVNSIIDALPFEAHVPGYHYLGI